MTETETASQDYFDLIPGKCLTASKSPQRFPSVYPKYIQKAEGCYIYDTDNVKYIDYVSGLGTNILGYAYPEVVNEVKKAVERGNLYSLESTKHFELAMLLSQTIQNAEKSKFFLNGSDACAAAVKVARAYTGKNGVLMFSGNYHGNNDIFTVHQDINYGVPEYLKRHSYILEPDIDLVKSFLDFNYDIACIITEPVTYTERMPFLDQLLTLCHQYNVVCIFDEIVTHLRSGIQGYSWMEPDLTCIGKAMSGGYPISAVVGRTDIMDVFDIDNSKNPCFYSGTFHGHELGAVAARTVINECIDKKVPLHIIKYGSALKEQFNTLAKEYELPVEMIGLPPRMLINYSADTGQYTASEIKSLFLQETALKGLVLGNIIYIGYQHTSEIISQTIEKINEAMQTVKRCIDMNTVSKSIIGRKCNDFVLRRDDKYE